MPNGTKIKESVFQNLEGKKRMQRPATKNAKAQKTQNIPSSKLKAVNESPNIKKLVKWRKTLLLWVACALF